MSRQFPTDFQRRTLWSALTGIALVVIGVLSVGVVLLLGKVLTYLQPVLVPLAVAGILAYLLNPVVEKLEKRGLTRLRSIICVFGLGALFAGLTLSLVVPRVVQQTGDLFQKQEHFAADLVKSLRTTPWLRDVANIALAKQVEDDAGGEQKKEPPENGISPGTDSEPSIQPGATFAGYDAGLENLASWVPGENAEAFDITETRGYHWIQKNFKELFFTGWDWIKGGAGKIFGFIGYALGFLLVPVYLFFFLRETSTIKQRWALFVPLRESSFKREVIETLSEMNGYLIAFFRGQVLVSFIDGALTGLLLWVIGFPYPFVIGLALAVLGIIPFIGFLVTLIPSLIIAATTWGDWQHPLLVFAIFFLVQQIDGLFIQPKIIGDKVGLHPMTIIFSIFFWSLVLGGFLGALLAIPLTASVKVLFTRYIWDPAVLDEDTEAGQTA